jgi:hypothetical protein
MEGGTQIWKQRNLEKLRKLKQGNYTRVFKLLGTAETIWKYVHIFMLIGKLIFQCQYFVYIAPGICTYFFANIILLVLKDLVLKHPI